MCSWSFSRSLAGQDKKELDAIFTKYSGVLLNFTANDSIAAVFRDPLDESFYSALFDRKINYFAKTKGMAIKQRHKYYQNSF